ncbi:MAG: hypothetical protein EBQ88_09690, partial [Betaproteobacteria bacterium]|nr:hypothetical protein [Betaproteobacteria bacterium]
MACGQPPRKPHVSTPNCHLGRRILCCPVRRKPAKARHALGRSDLGRSGPHRSQLRGGQCRPQ